MRCPECRSTAVRERPERTVQGYRRFRCLDCAKQFNERSTGLLNRTQYPSDVIALVVLWRLRYKLSLRDLAEMFLIRGFVFSYEAVRDWRRNSRRHWPSLRRRRTGKVGRSWYVDETYIRVHGGWKYLYRAIDHDGALVDVMLSEHHDLAAAKAFFRSAKAVTGVTPNRVTTDGHDGYPRAIRTELGKLVRHRTSRFLNNRPEQDHRGIKGRCRPMLGFKTTMSARRYCRGPRRTPKFPARPIPHAPTRSGGHASISSHAPNRDRTRHPGGRLTGPDGLPCNRSEGTKADRTRM
jgi:putative transposase